MNTRAVRPLLVLLVLVSVSAAPIGAADSPALGDLSKVGTVEFPTSCSEKVQPQFLRGMALLHSFFYEEARRIFTEVAKQDPTCAMAQWGVAMSWYHPIWAAPTDQELAWGLEAVEKAEAAVARGGKVGARERDWIAAVAAYYRATKDAPGGPVGQSCHGPTDAGTRRAAFSKAMEALYAKYPQDVEAAAFYALSLIQSSPTKEQIPTQLKAAGILEPLWKEHRNHPGLVHYLIHAYDYPSLAEKGLPAADYYATIAPWVPHALHMPSHIYTRLGMWQKSIEGNAASSRAARAYAEQYHPDAANYQELHALDYLAYGYLQTAQDRKARDVAERLSQITKTYPEVDFAVAYAAGAIPARIVLERQAWAEAVALPPANEVFVAKFPFDAAHVELARALGRVHTGDVAGARKAAARIQELHAASTDARFAYFKRQLELQQLAIAGWIAWAEKRNDEAIALLRYAADEEDTLGKHPVSPGSIVPIREMLGDLYLELGRPAEALAAYEQSLVLNPARYRGIAGAGRAAEKAGKPEVARDYFKKLLDLAKSGDGQRPETEHARVFLGEGTMRASEP
jgi:tetratricopeptide (TPR) repeat protein